jgi:cell division protein ZapA (FtsZ GTPase activity inhibitor)
MNRLQRISDLRSAEHKANPNRETLMAAMNAFQEYQALITPVFKLELAQIDTKFESRMMTCV